MFHTRNLDMEMTPDTLEVGGVNDLSRSCGYTSLCVCKRNFMSHTATGDGRMRVKWTMRWRQDGEKAKEPHGQESRLSLIERKLEGTSCVSLRDEAFQSWLARTKSCRWVSYDFSVCCRGVVQDW